MESIFRSKIPPLLQLITYVIKKNWLLDVYERADYSNGKTGATYTDKGLISSSGLKNQQII